VNMYTLPLDVFGGARAAFAVSMLVASYGVAQAAVSWAFGRLVDLHGYAPLTLVAALTPLAACAVLRGSVGRTSRSVGMGLRPAKPHEKARLVGQAILPNAAYFFDRCMARRYLWRWGNDLGLPQTALG
jgi:MFS family permease